MRLSKLQKLEDLELSGKRNFSKDQVELITSQLPNLKTLNGKPIASYLENSKAT